MTFHFNVLQHTNRYRWKYRNKNDNVLTQIYFSHKYMLNYLLIPKTGSTTVREWLECNKRVFWHHAKDGLMWDYPLFTVIRDPYERFLSAYNEAKRCGTTERTILETLDLGLNGVFRDRHLYPQSWWITEAENAGIEIDEYLECNDTLTEQLSRLTREDKGQIQLNASNKTRRLTYEHRQMIAEIYKDDFELYNHVCRQVNKA